MKQEAGRRPVGAGTLAYESEWRSGRAARLARRASGIQHRSLQPHRREPVPRRRAHAAPTFSIDVDTASYATRAASSTPANCRRRTPVRVEELINYFTYDYPQPGRRPFSVTTEVSACPWNDAHRLVHVGLQGRRLSRELAAREPRLLVDVSGSMDGPARLPLVQSSLRLLAESSRARPHRPRRLRRFERAGGCPRRPAPRAARSRRP